MADIPAHALRYFIVAAQERSFTQAASALHLSTASLSEAMAKLERSVGTALFTRSAQGVRLTTAGEQLLPHARRAADALDEVSLWAAGVDEAVQGEVRVGLFAAAGAPLWTKAAALLTAQHPDVDIVMRRLGLRETVAALMSGDLDVAVLPGPLDELMESALHLRVISEQSRVLVVRKDHRLAARSSVTIDETDADAFVTLAGAPEEGLRWWLVDPRPSGVRPQRAKPVTDPESMLDAVAAGQGIHLAGAAIASNYRRDDLAFVPVDGLPPVTICLLWRRGERSAAVLAYVSAWLQAAT